MSIFGAIGKVVGAAGGFLLGGPAGAAAGYSLGGSIGGSVDANQTKQQNKGLISQAYRTNVVQKQLQQANTREGLNENLGARGVLSLGRQSAPSGTAVQQVAKSGGGTGLDPYLGAAGVNAVSPANTLSGGANQQLTDQFALEQKDLADAKTQANNQNTANYENSIIGNVGNAIQGGLSLYGGAQANRSAAAIQGAYNMPANPTFFSGGGTVIGDNSGANYAFHG